MHIRGRRLRFTAVSALVVLALTGFSSGRHGSRGHHSGGGCSSSSQDHDSSSTSGSGGSSSSGSSGGSDDYRTSTGDSGGPTYRSRPTHRATTAAPSPSRTTQPLKDGTAVLVHCASTDDPYATVEIRNPNGRDGVFALKVSFKDRNGVTVIESGDQVSVPAKDRTTYRVPVAGAGGGVDRIDHCEVDPRATAVR
ncbi:hypothetical protein ACFWJM_03940 [Streptomyces sp. NPDC127077]|uniref:hypothetical protein n=1 Tax=Streptomyces sp. NPDC127077 TaxID=3347131 RepID=UPI003658EC80